jgi:hypothetical protein
MGVARACSLTANPSPRRGEGRSGAAAAGDGTGARGSDG